MQIVAPYRLVVLTQGVVELTGAVLSMAVATALVQVRAFHGLLLIFGIAVGALLEATVGPGRRRVRRDVIPIARAVRAVHQEPMRRHLLKAAGALLVLVCLLTLGWVAFEGFGTGFGVVPALLAANGARDLWTARWLARWEHDAGRRLLQDSTWPMPGRRGYYLQSLVSVSPA